MAVQATCNHVYDTAEAPEPSSMGDHVKQPRQLAAMQTAADFDVDKAAAAERSQHIAAVLSGMLHPKPAQQLSANQLAKQHWLQDASSVVVGPCPIVLWHKSLPST